MRDFNRVAGLAALGTMCAIAFSMAFNYVLLHDLTLTPFNRILISAIVVPPTIALPMSLLLASLHRENRRLRQVIARDAGRDPATEFLRAPAFSSLVDRRVNFGGFRGSMPAAFLIVDLENLQLINMRHGLKWREEVLRVVAQVIRTSLRKDDLVGRLGETEFGIFLPGTSEDNARQVAERIREGTLGSYLGATEEIADIRVTVGGLLIEHPVDFEWMLLAAERQLQFAQETGAVELAWQGVVPRDWRAN